MRRGRSHQRREGKTVLLPAAACFVTYAEVLEIYIHCSQHHPFRCGDVLNRLVPPSAPPASCSCLLSALPRSRCSRHFLLPCAPPCVDKKSRSHGKTGSFQDRLQRLFEPPHFGGQPPLVFSCDRRCPRLPTAVIFHQTISIILVCCDTSGGVVAEQRDTGTEEFEKKYVCEIVALPGQLFPLPSEDRKIRTKDTSEENNKI